MHKEFNQCKKSTSNYYFNDTLFHHKSVYMHKTCFKLFENNKIITGPCILILLTHEMIDRFHMIGLNKESD